MAAYKGDIFHIDWTNLAVVKSVASALEGVVGKNPNRPNYNIYVTAENAEQDGSVVVWPPREREK